MQPKKNSHCAHFIQYQHTNHAKDIIDIIPPSSSGCFFLILKHLLTLFTRPCLYNLYHHYGFKKKAFKNIFILDCCIIVNLEH